MTLPKNLAEQADKSMKDVYMFDILFIPKPADRTTYGRKD